MFTTRARRTLAALALTGAAIGATVAGAQPADAAPKPPANGGYSLAGIPVFLGCDDGSPTGEPFSANYHTATDASGHFRIAYGYLGQDQYDNPLPVLDFIPRTFTDERFFVLGPSDVLPSEEIYSENLPDAKIGSGKIPKGATLVTCVAFSPGALVQPQSEELPQRNIIATVTGYTVPE